MSKPILVFEGCDGAGKTTLARMTARRLNAVYTHHGTYTGLDAGHLMTVYSTSMLPALCDAAPVVLDRAWHSEPIYGRVFRGGVDRLGPRADALEILRLSVPSVLVVVEATFEEEWRTVNVRASEELAKRREQLERIHTGYQAAMWPDDVLRLPREGRTPELLLEIVLAALAWRMEA